MKSKLFYIAIVLIAILLLVFSLSSMESSEAIMAEVESQKTAISFGKPVQIRALHVTDGQKVKTGQVLLEVSRPDLILDRERLENDRQRELASRKKQVSEHKSKLTLLDIDVNGKIKRLQSQIAQLQAEIRADKNTYSSLLALAGADSSQLPVNEERNIRLASLENDIQSLEKYRTSERRRLNVILEENLSTIDLELNIIEREMATLKLEEASLKQVAPFDGTVSNVNSQLLELVPPYQTILSLFEERPSTIKAHLNLESGYGVEVGQRVNVESAARTYTVEGEIVEIGSRIISYREPGSPLSTPPLYGRELFVKLPPDNTFLYGEQVYVFIIEK